MNIIIIDQNHLPKVPFDTEAIADFLFHHLDQFGDPKEDILKCISYVFERGGFIALATQDEQILGAVVMNETGMSGYIPEYILVYIAVDKNQRGKGIGKLLMQEVINRTSGNIALHVEPDNPAKRLYEYMGFTNKYLEMRLIR